ncbi:hypothetical protein F5887DRAFT_1208434 [Amanita rubescens]|nr:hypothetical protein F5887DRAFT_1208434 [Amanita rubescens]
MPTRQAILGLLALLLVCTTQAVLVNRTIDDTYGDNITGQKPVYQPNGPWHGVECSDCATNPNASLAFDGTWTAATYHPVINNMNITFSFTGVAIWIFFILANANALGTIVVSNTNCNFTLDGVLVGSADHQPNENTEDLQYNVTVFTASSLSNDLHEMVISTNDYPVSTYLNFDYAIYTVDEPDNTTLSTLGPSSTSSITGATGTAGSTAAHNLPSNNEVGIAVGCVLGGLALVMLVAILFRRSRMKRKRPIEPVIASFNQQPFHGYRDEVAMRQISINNENPHSVTSYDLASGSAPLLVPVRREHQLLQALNTKDRGQDELRALRQMEIDVRLQTAQQEMQNLTSRQTIQREPGSSSSEAGSGREMETIHEHIRQLRAQISQLQMERSSDWAQGLTDEPPPPYH